jgi:hypothetical protein
MSMAAKNIQISNISKFPAHLLKIAASKFKKNSQILSTVILRTPSYAPFTRPFYVRFLQF